MYAIPTTTVSVLRGTTTDGYGDTIDGTTVASSGTPFSLVEKRRTVFLPETGRVQQIVYSTGRGPYDMDVEVGDRIKDEISSLIYVVENVSRVQSPVNTPDTRVDLRRASTS